MHRIGCDKGHVMSCFIRAKAKGQNWKKLRALSIPAPIHGRIFRPVSQNNPGGTLPHHRKAMPE
jgi:hypothetical protein